MAKPSPPITIGLPVYNGERYLEEAIKSILSQTYDDFTLIISDNASTDRTQEICQSYAAQDGRIKYFRNEENIGIARNFNRVFSLSESKYFKWAAYDDVIATEFLRACLEILDDEPEVLLAYPKTQIINTEGEIIGTYEDGLNLVSHTPHGRFLQVFNNLWLANPCYGLIRSSALKKSHLLGSYPNSDLVFLAELSLYGQFREVPKYLFFLRLHSSSHGGSIFSENKIIPAKKDKDKLIGYDPNKNVILGFKKHRIFHKHFININRSLIPLSSKIILFSFLLSHFSIIYYKRLANSKK